MKEAAVLSTEVPPSVLSFLSGYELISTPHPGVHKLACKLVSVSMVIWMPPERENTSVGRKEGKWMCNARDHMCPQEKAKVG